MYGGTRKDFRVSIRVGVEERGVYIKIEKRKEREREEREREKSERERERKKETPS